MSVHLAEDTIAHIRDLRYGDGLSIAATAAIVGTSARTISKHAPGRPGKVPVKPVRDVFLASGLSAASVASDIGWLSPQTRRNGERYMAGDSSRLRRRLGITAESFGHGPIATRSRGFASWIDAEAAGLIAEACGQPAWSVMPDEDAEPIGAFDPTPHLS